MAKLKTGSMTHLCLQKKKKTLSEAGLNVKRPEDRGRLSRMGGLAYFAEFLQSTSLFEELVQQCPLTAHNRDFGDKFGWKVGVSNGQVVVSG